MVNGHHDVLPVLVQRGADVDQQSGELVVLVVVLLPLRWDGYYH